MDFSDYGLRTDLNQIADFWTFGFIEFVIGLLGLVSNADFFFCILYSDTFLLRFLFYFHAQRTLSLSVHCNSRTFFHGLALICFYCGHSFLELLSPPRPFFRLGLI